jgi:hypothetical protein
MMRRLTDATRRAELEAELDELSATELATRIVQVGSAMRSYFERERLASGYSTMNAALADARDPYAVAVPRELERVRAVFEDYRERSGGALRS